MKRSRNQMAVLTTVLLALLPLLLYVYLGQFNRLQKDGYGYFGIAQEYGAWDSILFWREYWNSDYTCIVLYSLLAPLGPRVPQAIPTAIIAIGLIGFVWLNLRLLAFMGVNRHRRLVAVALASLILVAFVYGSYSYRSFFHFVSSVEYTLPVVVLVVFLALGAEAASRLRSVAGRTATAIIFAAIGFLNAGSSEMYLVFQLVFLAFIAVFFAMSETSLRRDYLVLVSAALLGTVTSLAIQASAPGAAYRIALTELWGTPTEPMRDLPTLVAGVWDTSLPYLLYQHTFSGCKMLAAAGLAATLAFSRSSRPGSPPRRMPVATAPLWLGTVVQLAFLPFLWSHNSNSLDVFGRFSYEFFPIICLNLALIISLLTMIWQRSRFSEFLSTKLGPMVYSSLVLTILGLLFVLPDIRSIDNRAVLYFSVTACLLTGLFIWQLAFALVRTGDLHANRIGLSVIVFPVVTVVSLAAMVAVSLWTHGFVFDRVLAPVTFLFMVSALVWGASIGTLIRRHFFSKAFPTWFRFASLLSVLAAATIGAGIVSEQVQMIDDLAEGARIWEETHQEIMSLLRAGDPAVDTQEFTFTGFGIHRLYPAQYVSRPMNWGERAYYGLAYEPSFG